MIIFQIQKQDPENKRVSTGRQQNIEKDIGKEVALAGSNREIVKNLEKINVTIVQIKDEKTGKTYPPPGAFWDLAGFNNMERYMVIDENGKSNQFNIKMNNGLTSDNNEVNDSIQKYKFVENKHRKKEISNNEWKSLKNGIIDVDEYIKKRGWTEEFQQWKHKELQRLAENAPSPEERMRDYVQGNIMSEGTLRDSTEQKEKDKDKAPKF